jgi:hypothetical protein
MSGPRVRVDLARLAAGVLHVPERAPAPVAFAADELVAYLRRIFGTAPARRAAPGDGGAWLCLAPGDGPPLPPRPPQGGAEWDVRPAGDAVTVAGTTPRACLAAVYALLAAAGCRWSPEGPADERIPSARDVETVRLPLEGRAAFARRVYAADLAGWHYTMPERLAARLPADFDFVDWMAKADATGFLFIRHANDTQWVVPELADALTRRGLDVEGGGHALVELLPRDLFATHPEYFPLGRDGRRNDCGNCCPSSPEALAVVRERARDARDAIPGARDLHLWGLDLLGGGWCACRKCARLTPSDQALVVANHAAEGLGAEGAIFHLAYHDTLEAPRLAPHPRVRAEFAPRERCYGHALDDPTCKTNQRYRRALEDHLVRFEGRVDVFEYYGDAILFGGCAVPLVEVVARDLEYYRRAGVRGVSCLVFGRYSLWAYGVNVEAFASGAVRPGNAPSARHAHCARVFGTGAEPMTRYLASLERLLAGVVTWGDIKLPPARPPRARRAHAAVVEALSAMPSVRALLAEAKSSGASPERIAAEEHLLHYTAATLDSVRSWLAARLGEADAITAAEAAATVLTAIARIQLVDPSIAGTWGVHDLEITHAVMTAMLDSRRDEDA